MSAAFARSRDRAIATMRWSAATVVLLGLTGTGVLAGLLARQHAEPANVGASGAESPPDAQTESGAGSLSGARATRASDPLPARSHLGRVLVIVHDRAAAGSPPAQSPAADPLAPEPVPVAAAPAPAPAPVPVVTPPPEPIEPAGSSSGSDPG